MVKKNKWMEVRYDVMAYVDPDGEIIAKIIQPSSSSHIWKYGEKEFIDVWHAQKHVEKIKDAEPKERDSAF